MIGVNVADLLDRLKDSVRVVLLAFWRRIGKIPGLPSLDLDTKMSVVYEQAAVGGDGHLKAYVHGPGLSRTCAAENGCRKGC